MVSISKLKGIQGGAFPVIPVITPTSLMLELILSYRLKDLINCFFEQ